MNDEEGGGRVGDEEDPAERYYKRSPGEKLFANAVLVGALVLLWLFAMWRRGVWIFEEEGLAVLHGLVGG